MEAKEFDKKIDVGEDITHRLDITKARRQEQKRVDFEYDLGNPHAYYNP